MIRNKVGRCESPSLACIDGMSIKTTRLCGECREIDGGKMIKGRKRDIITDTIEALIQFVMIKLMLNRINFF
jgi:putative transposase